MSEMPTVLTNIITAGTARRYITSLWPTKQRSALVRNGNSFVYKLCTRTITYNDVVTMNIHQCFTDRSYDAFSCTGSPEVVTKVVSIVVRNLYSNSGDHVTVFPIPILLYL